MGRQLNFTKLMNDARILTTCVSHVVSYGTKFSVGIVIAKLTHRKVCWGRHRASRRPSVKSDGSDDVSNTDASIRRDCALNFRPLDHRIANSAGVLSFYKQSDKG